MVDPKSYQYFALLLEALRSADRRPMRPAEAVAWIRARVDVPSDDLTRTVKNGRQSIFENQVHWVRWYLFEAGLIGKPKRGLWGLTPGGSPDPQPTPTSASARIEISGFTGQSGLGTGCGCGHPPYVGGASRGLK